MTHALHDLARHNAWATAELITFCQGLDAPTLQATVPGTYGTIIATLRHLLNSEASYLFRLHGAVDGYPWPPDDAVGLEVLAERAARLARTWEQYVASAVDTEWRMALRGTNPARYITAYAANRRSVGAVAHLARQSRYRKARVRASAKHEGDEHG